MNANQLTKIPVEKLSDTLQFLIAENEIPLSDALKQVIDDVDAVCKKLLRDESAPAQPVIPDNDDDDLIQRISGRAKFLRDKGEIKTPVLIEAAISALSAQPVSEPYKLNSWISVDEKMPEDGGAVLVHQDGGIIFCAEAEHGWFYPDEFPNIPKQGREITHWMPLPAAPAQDSE